MSPNKRIFLNIVATYGRSLYALIIGLFCGRWTLMALGEVDYGLYGVVGGLTAFIAFLNGILAGSIGRFYAFSVGVAQKTGCAEKGLAECRRWFTVAVSVHTVIPLVLMAVGYPLGAWAIQNYLTIPADRISDCIWVFRFVCVSCLLGMVSVPLNAMYGAKQYIAELTVYSFITTTLNAVFLYYMVTHSGIWLKKYAFWSCLLSIGPSLIIGWRAVVLFEECRIVPSHLFKWRDIVELLSFAGWNFFGALGNLLKGQGIAVLVNKMLGPVYNATMSIANSVTGHAQTLAGAMAGAFMPAITNACGAADRPRMVHLMHTTCKFGAVLLLPFALPIALEIDEIMVLWLKNPPPGVGLLVNWLLLVMLLENLTTGHWTIIGANGKIAAYQFTVGICFILTLPLAWLFMKLGWRIGSVGYALFTTLAAVAIIRLVAVKLLLGVSPNYWIFRILLPVAGASLVAGAVGSLPRWTMAPSFFRLCCTTLMTECVLLPLMFFFVFDASERNFLLSKLKCLLARFKA